MKELLQPGELILTVVHRHWFFILKEALVFLVLIIAPLALVTLYFGLSADRFVPIPGEPLLFFVILTMLWLFLLLPFVFVVWTDYYLDTLLITTSRVIIIEQRGLFTREIQSFSLDRIQDAQVEIRGLLATLLSFGTLHIQTAGAEPELKTDYIPNPERVKNQIFEQLQRAQPDPV